MIHTIEIRYRISFQEFQKLIPDIKRARHNGVQLYEFLNTTRNTFIMSSNIKGLTYLMFYRNPEYKDTIYLKLTIDIQSFITNSTTIDLFIPTYSSIETLLIKYAEAILSLFPSLSTTEPPTEYHGINCLPYLMLSTTTRIDYALNLETKNIEATLKLIKASYRDGRKKAIDFDNHNLFAKTSAKKTSSKTKFYDKELYYEECTPQAITETMKPISKNIIRYEYERDTLPKEWIMKHYAIPVDYLNCPYGRNPLTFFDSDSCLNILHEEYSQHIGIHDWKSDYHFQKDIQNSTLSTRKKNILIHEIAPIISQSRSVDSALEKYTKGGCNINGKIVAGAKATFLNYLKDFATAGVQPLRIPDRLKINHIVNPFNNIITPTTNLPYMYDFSISKSIKKNISILFDKIWQELGRKTPLTVCI